MAGFASFDDMLNKATVDGKVLTWDIHKVAPANAHAAGQWQTLWKGVGNPGAGADPAAGSGTLGAGGTARTGTATSPVVGGWCFPNVDPDYKFPATLSLSATQHCSIALYDRLVDVSGIALSSTGSKNVNSVALPRYSGADSGNVEAWLEVTTATTGTAPVVALNSYTTTDGSTAQSGGNVTFPAAATVLHTAIRLPKSATKQGIQSVQTVNVATAGTAGVATLVLAKRLVSIPLIANTENKINFFLDFPDVQRIFDGATLYLMLHATTTTAVSLFGNLTVFHG